MQKINIQSDFTPYTCDTYATFTDESFIEYELEYLGEKHGHELTTDNVEIDTCIPMVVKAIGNILAAFLVDNYEHIKAADVTKTFSPKYYNFTTDSVDIDVAYNAEAIEQYLKDNQEAWDEYQQKAQYYSRVSDDEKKLLFYIEHYATDEQVREYEDSVYEQLNEIYLENTIITINQKQS